MWLNKLEVLYLNVLSLTCHIQDLFMNMTGDTIL